MMGDEAAIKGAIEDWLDNGADPHRVRRELLFPRNAYHFSTAAESVWIASVEKCCIGCQGLLPKGIW